MGSLQEMSFLCGRSITTPSICRTSEIVSIMHIRKMKCQFTSKELSNQSFQKKTRISLHLQNVDNYIIKFGLKNSV